MTSKQYYVFLGFCGFCVGVVAVTKYKIAKLDWTKTLEMADKVKEAQQG